MPTWTGRKIAHHSLGTGRVLTDLADKEHRRGQVLVQFADVIRTRRWVDARNCTLDWSL